METQPKSRKPMVPNSLRMGIQFMHTGHTDAREGFFFPLLR